MSAVVALHRFKLIKYLSAYTKIYRKTYAIILRFQKRIFSVTHIFPYIHVYLALIILKVLNFTNIFMMIKDQFLQFISTEGNGFREAPVLLLFATCHTHAALKYSAGMFLSV